MRVYLVSAVDKYGEEFLQGIATTEEKANKMKEVVKEIYADKKYEILDCKIQRTWIETDTILVNDKTITIE